MTRTGGKRGLGVRALLLLGLLALALVGFGGIWQANLSWEILGTAVALVEPAGSPLPTFGDRGGKTILVGLGDFDEDGHLDVLASSRSFLQLYLGDGRGAFSLGPFFSCEQGPSPGAGQIVPISQGGELFTALSGAIADFNGDGHLDAAAVWAVTKPEEEGFEKQLHVFLGEGNGWLQQAQPPLSLERSSGKEITPSQLLAGDFDGDGIADLALVPLSMPTTSITLLRGIGNGIFSSQELGLQELGNPKIMKALSGDFDANGLLDLALQLHNKLIFLLEDGQGGFQLHEILSFSPEERLIDTATADLNGTGLLDLAIILSGRVRIYLQEAGGFNLAGEYEMDFGPSGLATGDFNGDGSADLLVSSVYSGVVALALGDGAGRLSEQIELFFWPGLGSQLLVADLDSDGRADLVGSTGLSIHILLSQRHPRGITCLRMRGTALLGIADLNSDSAPELLVDSPQGLDALWNTGQGAFVRRELADLRGVKPFRVISSDLDSDDALELIVLGTQGGDQWQPARWALGVLRVHEGKAEVSASLPLGREVIPNLGVGDLDGNGYSEIVTTASRELKIWTLKDDQLVPQSYGVDGKLGLAIVGDFDGDGRAEILAVVTGDYADFILFSLEEGELSPSTPLASLLAVPLALVKGDLNGDGVEDALALSIELGVSMERVLITGADLTLFLSDGQGGLQVITHSIPDWEEGASPWPYTGLTVGDFNGDAIPDLAYSTVEGGPVRLLPGDGRGGLGEPASLPCSGGPLFAADLDGNDQEELVTSTLGLRPYLCIFWNGGGR
ncbi:MAG: FG-GAP repeat domain-containing protein [Candidatus Bipolaricaulia bacterium]